MSFPIARNVLIVGASRGLGLEFVRQYRADGAKVTATARADAGLAAIAALGAKPLKLDVTDAASAAGLAWQIDGESFDTVLYVAGVYGPRTVGMEHIPCSAARAAGRPKTCVSTRSGRATGPIAGGGAPGVRSWLSAPG